MIFQMTGDFVKQKKIWVPERAFGVCIWIMPDGKPLSDGDGYLSAEGPMHDPGIERKMVEAVKYWTGSTEGKIAWVAGARKITPSELDDQKQRLNDGLVPDPYEDILDSHYRGR
jgi:hypothetical protein